MSDESDSEPQSSRKRKIQGLEGNASSGSSGSSPLVTTSRHRPKRRVLENSDSESGSSIDTRPRRRRVARVDSDVDSDSSGSVIVNRSRRPPRVVSESGDSDHGFEESSDSQWETDVSDTESPKTNTAKIQDTGVDSDSSDGQSEKCPICLLSFTNQEIGTPENCDHVFCVDCIQEWSKNMNTCPVDRHEYHTILVRKKLDGSIYKQIPIQRPNLQNEPDIVEDPTFCEVCGSSEREERMLLCDGCDLGFHLECLTPALQDVPVGAWFCNDCSPEDLVDPEIELFELQLLLDDAHEMLTPEGRPTRRHRIASPRLVPRTRQSERVRHRIATNRRIQTNAASQTEPLDAQVSSSSNPRPQRRHRKRKRAKPRYRVVYQMDAATGETVAVKKRIKRRRKKKRTVRTANARPKTVKKRLALQLGICPPRSVPQNVPDVKIQTHGNSIQMQRHQAGIPTLMLFGQRDELDLFSGSEGEDEAGGSGLLTRRAPTRSDVAAFRRARVKAINFSNPVSSSSDLLGSIMESQAKLHSKNAKLSVGKSGKVESTNDRVNFNDWGRNIRRTTATTTTYSNNASGDSVPSSSGTYQTPDRTTTTSALPPTEGATSADAPDGEAAEQFGNPSNSTDSCSTSTKEAEKKTKKTDDLSENNTPRTGTPCSESEIDIYSDIESVSTSKVDESDNKAPTPVTTATAPTDDENDSDTDMVIDTERINPEPEESTKEEPVTSTVDNEAVTMVPMPVASPEIQSGAIQSSTLLFSYDKHPRVQEEEDDSEDECPNFSIYSKESITMAKNTDISLAPDDPAVEETPTNGHLEEAPVVEEPQIEEPPVVKPPGKIKVSEGLYSDSEDETIVKKDDVSFRISDIRNMTEDISEDERSYTPCLDERAPGFREGLEGLDTEMISDEERNEFEESHELKTASDGDALEINAKESELDLTRPEDYEEGEIVDKLKNKILEEEEEEEEILKSDDVDEEEKTEVSPSKNNDEVIQGEDEVVPQIGSVIVTELSFKRLSKNTKERNYRDKDRERSNSRDRKEIRENMKRGRKERRKEIKRYDVRKIIAEKPRRLTDKFGRDINRESTTPTESPDRSQRSPSPLKRRSVSKPRRPPSRENTRKKRRRPRRSESPSNSPPRKRSRSKTKKRRRSSSKTRRRKSRDRSKPKKKDQQQQQQQQQPQMRRSKSPTPPRLKGWFRNCRNPSPEWTQSISQSRSPDAHHLTPSWTPPRMDNPVNPHNLTVILNNSGTKKKKEKKRRERKSRRPEDPDRQKKKKRSERSPPPSSKEVFASGDNILVSVSFNKDTEATRDVSTRKKLLESSAAKKSKKDKRVKPKPKRNNRDLSGIKPVAIIDLERSPFKELTPSPKDVIVLSDSDVEAPKDMCETSQQTAASLSNYATGPKTPPEPQVKFTLTTKPTPLRAITNPLHEPEDIGIETDEPEVPEGHIGPNTPPDPPNSAPSSPDAYDPFEPTKSPSPETLQATQSNSTNLDDNRDDDITETGEIDKEHSLTQMPDALKSHTPPLADVQPADSQSSNHASPESSLGKSPDRSSCINPPAVVQVGAAAKPVAQTIPFSSIPTIITSVPVSSSVAPSRVNIWNSIISPSSLSLPQRITLPAVSKASPVKVSPSKAAAKLVLPKTATVKPNRAKSISRNQNGSDIVDVSLSFDSPYSPGSSDYEDLFEPPVEQVKQVAKPVKATKSPNKIQNAFESLFGSSPFNKIKPKKDKQLVKKSSGLSKVKTVGVTIDEDNLKILDDLPNSAVEMQVKDKFLKKLNRQERVVEEVKLVLKPHYNKKHINKEEYKDILRRAVPKICHNKTGEINPTKIKHLIEAYVKKIRHSKKVTSSSSKP